MKGNQKWREYFEFIGVMAHVVAGVALLIWVVSGVVNHSNPQPCIPTANAGQIISTGNQRLILLTQNYYGKLEFSSEKQGNRVFGKEVGLMWKKNPKDLQAQSYQLFDGARVMDELTYDLNN